MWSRKRVEQRGAHVEAEAVDVAVDRQAHVDGRLRIGRRRGLRRAALAMAPPTSGKAAVEAVAPRNRLRLTDAGRLVVDVVRHDASADASTSGRTRSPWRSAHIATACRHNCPALDLFQAGGRCFNKPHPRRTRLNRNRRADNHDAAVGSIHRGARPRSPQGCRAAGKGRGSEVSSQAPLRLSKSNGSERRRLPVAAKIAFDTAGATGGTPGSPTPGRRLRRGHDVDLDLRHVAHAQRLVAVEVGLLDHRPCRR